MKKNPCCWLAVFLFMIHPVFAQIDYKGFPEWSLQKQDSTEYALYTPGHLEAGKKYPVVLFMHGCCGADNHASLRNAVDPPVRMWHQFGKNIQAVPTYIIAPATARGWNQHFAALKKVMDKLIAQEQGDPQRVYVCGFSMGGEGSFSIIQQYPGYFAAAIPMGMSFSGDSLKIKDIPLWINQGETDYYSRHLRRQVAATRALNNFTTDTGDTHVTGVNPRYSNFKGVGHGVQWIAASTQDLTGWAYSKINDGHHYPTVFFEPGAYPITAKPNTQLTLSIHAGAVDTIERIDIYVNHIHTTALRTVPYLFSFRPVAGDNLVEAVAQTKHGKTSTATTVVKINTPARWLTTRLAAARAGDLYAAMLQASGNGKIAYTLAVGSILPTGIDLYPNGMLKGICAVSGNYGINLVATDEDGDTSSHLFYLEVLPKPPGKVLVTNAGSDSTLYRISEVREGEALFFNSKDSVLSANPEEINFSEPGRWLGLTFIRTNENDANQAADNFLHFTIDEDALVFVAYEKIDKPSPSRVPAWLQYFTKENASIVAQYRYFDVYSKPFKKGTVVLPGAAANKNGIGSNYFIMVKKQ